MLSSGTWIPEMEGGRGQIQLEASMGRIYIDMFEISRYFSWTSMDSL